MQELIRAGTFSFFGHARGSTFAYVAASRNGLTRTIPSIQTQLVSQ